MSARVLPFPSTLVASRRAPLVPDDVAVRAAAELVRILFPARSETAMCQQAGRVLGCSEQTVRRMLRGETRSAPWPVVARCQVLAVARGIDPLALIQPAPLRVAA